LVQKLPRYQGFERGSAGPGHRGVRIASHNQLMASDAVSLRGSCVAAFLVRAPIGMACLLGVCERTRMRENES
jgi:hypothetical protein